MANYAILITFMLVPFGFLQFGVLHGGHHLALILSSLVIIGWQVKNRAFSLFITYLAAWMAFILVFAMCKEVPKQVVMGAMDATLYIGFGSAVFYCVTQSAIRNETFYNAICAAVLIQMAFGISQHFGFDPLTWGLGLFFATQSLIPGHMTGTLGNNNFLAAFVAISLPLFFRPRWRWFLPVLALVLYGSNTTSAVVPAVLASAWYFRGKLTKREQVLSIIGAVLVIGAYSCFQHTPFYKNPRWIDWTAATKQLFYSPWAVVFGMCPGAGWGKPYPMHNEWLQAFHQYGAIGFFLIAWFVHELFFTAKNRMLTASLMIAAINMFGNYSLHLAPSAFLIIIIAGLIERERNLCHAPI